MAIILDQKINDIDLSKIGVKSHKKVNVRCSECGSTWKVSRHSVANETTSCKKCNLIKSSPWFHDKELKELLESILVYPKSLPIKQSSKEKVKIYCSVCKIYQSRNWRKLLKVITSGEDWCYGCHPSSGGRTGELLIENYPKLMLRCKDNVDDFALFNASKPYVFSFGCGHDDTVSPKYAYNNDLCTSCKSKEKQERNRGMHKDETGKMRFLLSCENCGNEIDIAKTTKRENIKRYNKHLCVPCKNNENSYFLNKTFLDISDLLERNGLIWSAENKYSMSEISLGSGRVIKFNCAEGHYFENVACSINRDSPTCPQCSTSTGEKSLTNYIENIVGKDRVKCNKRDIIAPRELDIYIPELSIAIEYNGLYWHTEEKDKDKNYHYNKWKMCQDKGIQLITIWEDDWINKTKRKVIKSIIESELGVSTKAKVSAQDCELREIDVDAARDFCDTYHLQGFTSGTFYLGLFHKDKLVALSVWRKYGTTLYLDRYCTSIHIIVTNGLEEMLKLAQTKAQSVYNCTQIVTFSDNCTSTGVEYKDLGLVKDKNVQPDYFHLVKGARANKSNYRKKRFKNDPDLKFKEGLSESELAKLNKIHKIWDCGKVRWIKSLN